MKTFLLECVRSVNLPYTILLGGLAAYWISVILGMFDIELFDFDVEVEADADLDVDMDVEVEAEFGFANILGFLNVGAVPFSVWLSILSFQMWAYSLLGNLVIDGIFPTLSGWLRFGLCGVVFFPISAILTKFLTAPLKSAFEGRTTSKHEFVGKECLVTSSTVDAQFGTAEIAIGEAPQLIDIRARPEEPLALKKGERALIYDYDAERDVFYVTNG